MTAFTKKILVVDDDKLLIITDLRMPDIDGTELCNRIRKINSESVIYALSGYIEKFEPEKLERIGFDGHLCKPVEIKVLKHAIEDAFDKIDQRRGKAIHASV